MADKVAFVLSGGGSLGSVQVGMLRALLEIDIKPDLLIGTSVGALNAAYLAGHGATLDTVDSMEKTWLGLKTRDVFPFDPLRLSLATVGLANSLCSNNSLRRIIKSHLTFKRIEDAPIPLHVVTTDLRSGKEVLLSKGDAVKAILASSAIPAIFPSIEFEGRSLIDGGVADNAAISQAIDLGADLIYVLPTGYTCDLREVPRTALASAVHALTLLMEQRLIVDVEHYEDRIDIRVMPPLCPLSVSSIDFRHTARLIADSYEATAGWLKTEDKRSRKPERVLSLHSHKHGASH